MIWIVLLVYVLYYIFLIGIYYGWIKIEKPSQRENSYINFSVIIPVRNEAENIRHLLRDLEVQNYPHDKYEVIVIDDRSTDETTEIIRNSKKQLRLNLSLLKQTGHELDSVSPKKEAIEKGIERATGDYIVLTDGDSRTGNNWLNSINSAIRGAGALLITGPVGLKAPDTLFEYIQQFDLASLTGTSAAFIQLRYPVMCNGANLAFSKAVYEEVDGYAGNRSIKSGDDAFLLHKVHKRHPGSVYFLKSQDAIVTTRAAKNWRDFFNQRIRWAGKWNKFGLSAVVILALSIFLINLVVIVSLFMVIAGDLDIRSFVILILLKIIFEGIFLKKVFVFFKSKFNFGVFIVCSMLYPFYAVFFGIMANLSKYSWKGRTYKI